MCQRNTHRHDCRGYPAHRMLCSRSGTLGSGANWWVSPFHENFSLDAAEAWLAPAVHTHPLFRMQNDPKYHEHDSCARETRIGMIAEATQLTGCYLQGQPLWAVEPTDESHRFMKIFLWVLQKFGWLQLFLHTSTIQDTEWSQISWTWQLIQWLWKIWLYLCAYIMCPCLLYMYIHVHVVKMVYKFSSSHCLHWTAEYFGLAYSTTESWPLVCSV